MQAYSGLVLEKKGYVASVKLSHPPANTWTLESLRSLLVLLDDLNADATINTLILSGAGDKFFSAGADLNLFANGDKYIAREMSQLFGRAFEALADWPGVTIAALNGYAMGGGLEVALACDTRIAESHVQLALPEAAVGLLPCAGGTQNLAWLVGEAWAKRMILCGERIDAATAEKIGLVEQIVPTGQSLTVAFELAEHVTKQSPDAIRACKSLIHLARHQPLATAYEVERLQFLNLFDSANQKEGVQAFLEKRAAKWTNA